MRDGDWMNELTIFIVTIRIKLAFTFWVSVKVDERTLRGGDRMKVDTNLFFAIKIIFTFIFWMKI